MALPSQLCAEIDRYGYHPDLIAHGIDIALAGQDVVAQLVLAESAFDTDQVRRHMTVALLTATRLIITHTDDAGGEGEDISRALTTTEAVQLSRVKNVQVTMGYEAPESYVPGQLPAELVMWASWGGRRHLELDVSMCMDPACEADHGYSGTSEADDFNLPVSLAANGPAAMRAALEFASALHRATVNA